MSGVGFDLRQIFPPFLKKNSFLGPSPGEIHLYPIFSRPGQAGESPGDPGGFPGGQRNSEDRGGEEAVGLELKLPWVLPLQIR